MMKKILVIDDDDAILEAVRMAMEMENFEVETLNRGGAVMEVANEFKPDLIILDYLLSGEDGREMAKKIRTEADNKEVPIIMFSAHPNAERSVGGYGINEFLPKPFDLDVLIRMVSKYTAD